MNYVVVYEKSGTGWAAYVPDLPGCVATGRTREEARQRITYSIPHHIASLRAHGEAVPPPAAEAERVTVAA